MRRAAHECVRGAAEMTIGEGAKAMKDAVHGRYADGEVVFRQGSEPDGMYVIRSGRIRIYREHAGKEIDLATLGQGDFFGEVALFDGKPRSASARAVGEAVIERVDRARLEMMSTDPLLLKVLERMSGRIRDVDDQLEKLSAETADRHDAGVAMNLRRDWLV